MKKVVGIGILVGAFLVLRRYGPSVRAWCEVKCQDMMAGRRGDVGVSESEPSVTSQEPALAVT